MTAAPREPGRKSLARSLGEFVGHIVKGVKADPERDRREIGRDVRETQHRDVTLRRTTIDEVEFRDP